MQTDLTEGLLQNFAVKRTESYQKLKNEALEGSSIDKIFEYIAKEGKQLSKGKEVPDKAHTFTFTRNANIINYNAYESSISQWSLTAGKTVTKNEDTDVTVIYPSPNNKKYYVGHSDGKLDELDPTSMQVKSTINLGSHVLTVITDEKVVYVSLGSGKIIYFPFEDMTLEALQTLEEGDGSSYMSMLKLSKDKAFLVGYVDIDEKEGFFVYNLAENKRIWQGVLDLSPNNIREDPNKLLHISDDCLNLYARSANNKGVTMYSLFDGSVVAFNNEMHTNYIFSFVVTKDGKTVITTGKDKKIKVWDWVKKKLITTLLGHSDSIESLVLS